MTRKEAEHLLREKEGRLCIRYFQRQDGTILTDNCPVGLRAARRRVLKWCAVAASGLGLLFKATAEQAHPPAMGTPTRPSRPTMGDAAPPSQPTMGMVRSQTEPVMGNAAAPTPQPVMGKVATHPSQPVMGGMAPPAQDSQLGHPTMGEMKFTHDG